MGEGERKNTSNVPDCIRLEHWNYARQVCRSNGDIAEEKIDVCCVQVTRCTGSGARVMGKGMSRYKFFWQGCKDGNSGVGFLISDRWIDRIVDAMRVNERIMCLKVLIGDKLITHICAYAPQTGRSAEEKDSFWDQITCVNGRIPVSGVDCCWRGSEWSRWYKCRWV